MASGISTGSTYADESAPMSAINVTPLVDVTLVLLIVFMITVPAIVGTAPVKVELPESSDIPQVVEEAPLVFTLKRGEAGGLELYLNGERTDEAGVKKVFQELGPVVAEQDVSLSAGKDLSWDEMVQVIDLLKSHGVEKLRLNTKHAQVR